MKFLAVLLALAGTCILMAAPGAANAQATRTWISGVGDDVNPCSRTAPCKTFPGAISKTAAGGEIDTLDPGGFGAVTVVKAITLADEGIGEGGILVAGTNGITVNCTTDPNCVVVVRGLQIDGGPVGSNSLAGIKFMAGKALFVYNTTIRNFTGGSPNGYGINFAPSTGTSQLFVSNSQITTNGPVGSGTGGGIFIDPTGAGTIVNATITNSQVSNNTAGIRLDMSGASAGAVGTVQVESTEVSGNANGGVAAILGGGGATGAIVLVDRSNVSNNAIGFTGNGGAGATVRVGNSVVSNNGMAFKQVGAATLTTYGNNAISNNTPGGYTPTAFAPS